MADTFNFDIDKIADNAITKTDKTTEIIVATDTTSTGQVSFYDKLTPEQQTAITAKAPAWLIILLLTRMHCLILEHLLLKKLTRLSIAFWQNKRNWKFRKLTTCSKMLTVN